MGQTEFTRVTKRDTGVWQYIIKCRYNILHSAYSEFGHSLGRVDGGVDDSPRRPAAEEALEHVEV